MVEINCIKIRDYKNFNYKGHKITDIWKGYDEENEDEIFIWFKVDGKETFSRSTTLEDLKFFLRKEFDFEEFLRYWN